MVGKIRRLSRIFGHETGRTIIVPIDDSLISGPEGGLLNLRMKVEQIAAASPNAILGFPGHFEQYGELLGESAWICNLTASTTRSSHTRKTQILSVKGASTLGVDCVAAHVNITSRYETEMLATLARVIEDGRRWGMPVLAIMYPRAEKPDGSDENYEQMRIADPDSYVELVSHCVRVAKDLGADIIKTQFTGSGETFRRVVAAADPVPVVIAGGPLVSALDALEKADEAIRAGGLGISYGRNVFNRPDSAVMIKAIGAVITGDAVPRQIVTKAGLR